MQATCHMIQLEMDLLRFIKDIVESYVEVLRSTVVVIILSRHDIENSWRASRRTKKPEEVTMTSQLKLKTAKALDKIPQHAGPSSHDAMASQEASGMPMPSRKYGGGAAIVHVQSCFGEPIDQYVENVHYCNAIVAMAKVERECLGLLYKKPLWELAQSTWLLWRT